MIVSFERNFIYIAIPRTATHSFRRALRPYLGPRDWEQCVLFEKKSCPVVPLAGMGHGHITAGELQPFLLPRFWEQTFKFCTVRNPFDRFVSCCHFAYRDTRKMSSDPLGTMKRAIHKRYAATHILFRPQYQYITDDNGELLVDYVSNFENLRQDFAEICGHVGIATALLETANRSSAPAWQSCYDDELEGMVAETYQADFAILGYPAHRAEVAACR